MIGQMTIQTDRQTTYGDTPEHIARELEGLGVDAVGLNCSVGPAIILEAIGQMSRTTDLPISAVPNAGLPKEVQGRKI